MHSFTSRKTAPPGGDVPPPPVESVAVRLTSALLAEISPAQLNRIIADKTNFLRMYLTIFPEITGVLTRKRITAQLSVLEWYDSPGDDGLDLTGLTDAARVWIEKILRCGDDFRRLMITIQRLMLELDAIHFSRSKSAIDPTLMIAPLTGASRELVAYQRMIRQLVIQPAGGSVWRAMSELAEPDGFWALEMIRALDQLVSDPPELTAEMRSNPLVCQLLRWIGERTPTETEMIGDLLPAVLQFSAQLAKVRLAGLVVEVLKIGCIPQSLV